jgi:RNA polymerase sigma-B factor
VVAFFPGQAYDRVMTVVRDDERRRLIEAHLPLVGRVAARFTGFGERREDLAQVGALALVRAIDRRDPARGELGAYVARCVEGEIRRHLRDRSSVVRIPRRARSEGAAAATLPLEDDRPDGCDPLDELLLDRALVASASRALDARERQLELLRFFCDRTQAEIAAELGLSQAQVSRLLDGAIAKMRRRLQPAAPLSASTSGGTLRGDGQRREQAGGFA